MEVRAEYNLVGYFFNKKLIFIVDKNNGAMSVTNDAEAVVDKVTRDLGRDFRVIYRDSTGRWDELYHDRGKFKGFGPYTGSTFGVEENLPEGLP